MNKKNILIGVGLLVVVGVGYYGYKKGLWFKKKEAAPAPLTAETLPAVQKVGSLARTTRVTGALQVQPSNRKNG